METGYNGFTYLKRITVQSNLWGMETKFPVCKLEADGEVQSNLWGMETSTGVCSFYRYLTGSIESMRNGNLCNAANLYMSSLVQSNLWGMETRIETISLRQCEPVQSNLWGMETSTIQAPNTPFCPSSIESMRNGNHQYSQRCNQCSRKFNRIYEEWKQ